MAKQMIIESEEFPAEQGNYQVGYKHPPREHQFKPGQSGNPKGVPKHRCNLWRWVCMYMNMTDAEIRKIKKREMTQVQKTALKIVLDMAEGKACGSERLARHVFDREEGRAVERVVYDRQEVMTEEQCERIREFMRKKFES